VRSWYAGCDMRRAGYGDPGSIPGLASFFVSFPLIWS